MADSQPSPVATRRLLDDIEDGTLTPFSFEADDRMGETDCPEGCKTDADGSCPHGYLSAALTGGLI